MADEKQQAGEIKMKSPFFKKADNYWYHYKWHTIIGLFLVAVILICTLQTCTRDDYDIEIMYAGPYNLNQKQTILDLEAAFADLAEDATGDGVKAVNIVSYWVNEKLAEMGAESDMSAADLRYSLNHSLENQSAYLDEIAAGNLVICLVSPHLFHMVDDQAGFMRVTDIYPELAEFEEDVCVYDEDGKINRFGVVLSKTAFGQRAGLSSLPDDTILCIRKPAALKAWFGAAKAEAAHNRAVELFRKALALGPKE